jgi:hypothetical protein
MVLWLNGGMVLWLNGDMVLWLNGGMVLWSLFRSLSHWSLGY